MVNIFWHRGTVFINFDNTSTCILGAHNLHSVNHLHEKYNQGQYFSDHHMSRIVLKLYIQIFRPVVFLGKLQWPKNQTRILGATKIFIVDFKGLENI